MQIELQPIYFAGEIFDYLVSSVMAVEMNNQGQLEMKECINMSQGDVILRCQDGSMPCHKLCWLLSVP